MYPSLIAHFFGALVLLVAILIFVNNYKRIVSKGPYSMLILLLLTSAVITLHGLSHLGLESAYGFNPLKWLVSY